MEYLSKDEVLRVLAAAKDVGPREHLMILLAYRHGLRASEICLDADTRRVSELPPLMLKDVRDNRIVIRRVKGSLPSVEPLECHSNPLLDERIVLAAWLQAREDAAGSQFLFTSRNGSGLRRRQFHNIVKTICAAAGIEDLRAHAHIFRHSYAMHLREGGLDVFELQRRLGHADIKSTAKYIHVTTQQAAVVAAGAMDKLFA